MSGIEAKPTIIIDRGSDYFDGLYVHEEKIATYMSTALQMRRRDIAKTTLCFVARGFAADEPLYDASTRTAVVPLDDERISTKAASLTTSRYMTDREREELSMPYSRDFSKLASLSLAICAHEEKIRRRSRAASTVIGVGACASGMVLGVENGLADAGMSQLFGIAGALQIQLLKQLAIRRFNFEDAPDPDGELVSFFLKSNKKESR